MRAELPPFRVRYSSVGKSGFLVSPGAEVMEVGFPASNVPSSIQEPWSVSLCCTFEVCLIREGMVWIYTNM